MTFLLVLMLAGPSDPTVELTAAAAAQDTPSAPQQAAEESLQKFPETAPPHAVLLHPHREQRDKYLWGTFGPPGMLDAALGAALGQWQDTPKEWGQGTTAFAKRYATEYTEAAINATTRYALARLRDEDPSFHRCECSGFRRRAWHAIISPVVAYRFDDGRMQFSMARIGGTAATSFISASTWKPGDPAVGATLAHVGTDLLGAAGVGLLREFVFHHRAPKPKELAREN